MPFTITNFWDLNFSELRVLEFYKLPWDQCIQIMDLALQSNCTSMVLNLTSRSLGRNFFTHKLLQQVVDIGIATR
jgi:hypothetical protein